MGAEPTVTDGRRARRARGRLAVVDATIALLEEGRPPGSAEEVAARAGVSASTVFRYFDGLDDLRAETIARFIDRHRLLYEVPGLGEGDFADRADRFVVARVGLYAAIAPVARFVRARAVEQEALARSLRERRRFMHDQAAQHFSPELSDLPVSTRDEVVGAVSSLTSFEAWDLLVTDLGYRPTRIRSGWTTSLHAILTASA